MGGWLLLSKLRESIVIIVLDSESSLCFRGHILVVVGAVLMVRGEGGR